MSDVSKIKDILVYETRTDPSQQLPKDFLLQKTTKNYKELNLTISTVKIFQFSRRNLLQVFCDTSIPEISRERQFTYCRIFLYKI